MMNLREIAESTLKAVLKQGNEKGQVSARETTTSEVEIASREINMFRTVFDHAIGLKAVRGGRQGKIAGNDLSKEGVENMLKGLTAMVEASPVDEAYDIADIPVKKEFIDLPKNVDLEKMVIRANDFINYAKAEYPQIVTSGNLRYVETHEVLYNSNGVQLETKSGHFENMVFFTSKDGLKTSSFEYTGILENEMGGPLQTLGGLEELMEQSIEHLNPQSLPQKFVGDVLMTPYFVEEILGSVVNQLSTDALMTGQSLYQDSLNKKIMSESITLKSEPNSPRFAGRNYYSSEGFLNEPTTIIENGTLKSYLLGQYGANKLNRKRATTSGGHWSIQPGETRYADLIKNVKQGILLRRLSAGMPAVNGDFSGVAKNSFYIENGKIAFPIKEVMVSGNYSKLFNNVKGVSKETIFRGDTDLPWIHCSGVTVS